MNQIRHMLIALWCVATLGVFVPAGAFAQAQSKPVVIAVLDMRVIHRDSLAGKAWQDYYNARRKELKDKIGNEEKTVRAAWDELNKQRAILAPQAFQARERSFREMEAAANGRVRSLEQDVARDLRGAQAELGKVLDEKLAPILEGIIRGRNIDLILRKDDLVFMRKELDLTPEVLKQLDKALPKLDVKSLVAKAKAKK